MWLYMSYVLCWYIMYIIEDHDSELYKQKKKFAHLKKYQIRTGKKWFLKIM